jgi:hypothetical protein
MVAWSVPKKDSKMVEKKAADSAWTTVAKWAAPMAATSVA